MFPIRPYFSGFIFSILNRAMMSIKIISVTPSSSNWLKWNQFSHAAVFFSFRISFKHFYQLPSSSIKNAAQICAQLESWRNRKLSTFSTLRAVHRLRCQRMQKNGGLSESLSAVKFFNQELESLRVWVLNSQFKNLQSRCRRMHKNGGLWEQ